MLHFESCVNTKVNNKTLGRWRGALVFYQFYNRWKLVNAAELRKKEQREALRDQKCLKNIIYELTFEFSYEIPQSYFILEYEIAREEF